MDTAIYSHIFTHQGSQPFLRLKIALRDAVFYLACRNADPAQRAEFQARSARFAQLLQGENPSLEACAQALDQVNDYLSQLSAIPVLQAIEGVFWTSLSSPGTTSWPTPCRPAARGRRLPPISGTQNCSAGEIWEGVHSAMDRKLDLWLSLNIV